MRRLEALVNLVASDRAARKGETVRNPLAWFQAPSVREPGDEKRWPIDKVIEWSKTSHGGRQMELFDLPESERGCLRWGLCEAGPIAAEPTYPDGSSQPFFPGLFGTIVGGETP
jgi:hypothetical protein